MSCAHGSQQRITTDSVLVHLWRLGPEAKWVLEATSGELVSWVTTRLLLH